ncbi:hypothetical protein PVA45_03000 [Entomospira entomophila]|uniref:Uncharacterized protein n=1 Tax=Entomospira entomophila TaxID=2719988 RepID=A0A968G8E9_9SPIO|nr:hypothetical protein [Entomospira entomophilus]NIZ40482.1 hypothetical protein [Entomospira entomophilus]WDI36040.1 hypothetical protein PVA45_03000 [Entomospira entomophilus]
MQTIDTIIALKATIERELSLIKEFNAGYDALRMAVQGKKWPVLQNILKESTRLAQDVSQVEEKRDELCQELYSAYELPSERSFFELVAFFPEDMRERMKSAYLQLRAEVYKMKCRLKSLEAYSRVRMQLVDEVINKNHVVQQNQSSAYKRTGKRALQDPDSFLFDSIK